MQKTNGASMDGKKRNLIKARFASFCGLAGGKRDATLISLSPADDEFDRERSFTQKNY